MQKVDLQLRRSHLLRQRVDPDALLFAERIHVDDKRVEVIHLIDTERLPRCICATQPALGRLDFRIGVCKGTN